MKRIHLPVIVTLGLCLPALLCAQVPQLINYQGRVTVAGTNFTGTGQFKFALVNPTGSTNYWSNNGVATGEPAVAVSLAVSNGLYAVLLGDTTVAGMTVPIAASVFNNSDVRVRVWFNDGVSGFQQLTPDRRLGAVGYAMLAGNVADGAITSAKILDSTVADADISASAAIADTKLAIISTAGKVADTALSPNVSKLGASIESAEITDATIVNADINASAAIADTKLATISTAGKVADTALSANVSKLGASIETGEITDGTIVDADISAAAAIAGSKINGNISGNAAGFSGSLAGDVTGAQSATTVGKLQGRTVASTAPTDGQALKYNASLTRWEPGEVTGTPDPNADLVARRLNIGIGNTLSGTLATIAGGSNNTASAVGDAVGGGYWNQAMGGYSVVAGGEANSANGYHAGALAGLLNKATNDYATVAGGQQNIAGGVFTGVGGGVGNMADGQASTVAGGEANTAGGLRCFVGGGWLNRATNSYASVTGGQQNTAGGIYTVVSGGHTNTASGYIATVGGGSNNTASNEYATVSGGYLNTAGGAGAMVGGGQGNTASGFRATVGGGRHNTASDFDTTVGGGYFNTASGVTATVGGGNTNIASSYAATVGGGYHNIASNQYATVPGGYYNVAGGLYSLAAGYYAYATNDGAFVWSNAMNPTGSFADNTFTVRAHGGARIYTAAGTTTGVELAAGGGSWSSLSDRNLKENFEPLDYREILEQVAAVPVTKWNLKSQPQDIRHIGPMAQDFAVAFRVGEDNTHISSSDADGVALAAIKGLYDLVKQQQAEIAQLKSEIAEMRGGRAMKAPSNIHNPFLKGEIYP